MHLIRPRYIQEEGVVIILCFSSSALINISEVKPPGHLIVVLTNIQRGSVVVFVTFLI